MLTCVIYADVIHIPAMQAAGYWRAAHHWDEHSIYTLNGTAFAPEQHGVLDRGYVAAGKMGGNADNDSMGRRVSLGGTCHGRVRGRTYTRSPGVEEDVVEALSSRTQVAGANSETSETATGGSSTSGSVSSSSCGSGGGGPQL